MSDSQKTSQMAPPHSDDQLDFGYTFLANYLVGGSKPQRISIGGSSPGFAFKGTNYALFLVIRARSPTADGWIKEDTGMKPVLFSDLRY